MQLLREYLDRALDIIVESTTDAYQEEEDDTAPSSSRPFGSNGAAGGSTSSTTLDATGDNNTPTPESSPMAGRGANSAHSSVTTAAAQVVLTPQVGLLHVEGTKMSELLRPPGIPLNIESTCMALNERIVAAESCCFTAMVSSIFVVPVNIA